MIQINRFARKPLHVGAVQVTKENLIEVANWCSGDIQEEPTALIKVEVVHPMNERQTMAYIGDWILKSDLGFKIYNKIAFEKNFELIAEDVS